MNVIDLHIATRIFQLALACTSCGALLFVVWLNIHLIFDIDVRHCSQHCREHRASSGSNQMLFSKPFTETVHLFSIGAFDLI